MRNIISLILLLNLTIASYGAGDTTRKMVMKGETYVATYSGVVITLDELGKSYYNKQRIKELKTRVDSVVQANDSTNESCGRRIEQLQTIDSLSTLENDALRKLLNKADQTIGKIERRNKWQLWKTNILGYGLAIISIILILTLI